MSRSAIFHAFDAEMIPFDATNTAPTRHVPLPFDRIQRRPLYCLRNYFCWMPLIRRGG